MNRITRDEVVGICVSFVFVLPCLLLVCLFDCVLVVPENLGPCKACIAVYHNP